MGENLHAPLIEFLKICGLGYAIVLAFVLLAEVLIRQRSNKSLWSQEARNSLITFLLFGPVAGGLALNAILVGGLALVFEHSPLRVPVNGWTLPIYFLVGELAYYVFHRFGHEVRLLWADHSIHHSAKVYDFTVNLRFVPFQFAYRLALWIPFAALGFNPWVLVVLTVNIPAFQTLCHTERLGRFSPWFEWFFVTPCNHAVHHAKNEPYLDKNYGGLTMLWDHIFGTYQRLSDDNPPQFGITHQLSSTSLMGTLSHEFVPLYRDFRAAPGRQAKLRVLFGRPGHTFSLPREQTRALGPGHVPKRPSPGNKQSFQQAGTSF